MLRCNGRIRLSYGAGGAKPPNVSRPNSLAGIGWSGLRQVVLWLVAPRCDVAERSFGRSQDNARAPLDSGCFCLVVLTNRPSPRFPVVHRDVPRIRVEHTAGSRVVAASQSAGHRDRDRIGSDPTFHAATEARGC